MTLAELVIEFFADDSKVIASLNRVSKLSTQTAAKLGALSATKIGSGNVATTIGAALSPSNAGTGNAGPDCCERSLTVLQLILGVLVKGAKQQGKSIPTQSAPGGEKAPESPAGLLNLWGLIRDKISEVTGLSAQWIAALGTAAATTAVIAATIGTIALSVRQFVNEQDSLARIRNEIASMNGDASGLAANYQSVARRAMEMSVSFSDAYALAASASRQGMNNIDLMNRFANNAIGVSRILRANVGDVIHLMEAGWQGTAEQLQHLMRHAPAEIRTQVSQMQSPEQIRQFFNAMAERGFAIQSNEAMLLDNTLQRLMNSFQELLRLLGKVFGPATARVISFISQEIQKLNNIIANILESDFVQQWADIVTYVALAVVGIVAVEAAILAATAVVGGLMAAVGALLTPWTLFLVIIGAAVAGIGYLWYKFADGDTILEKFENTLLSLQNIWDDLMTELKLLWDAVYPTWEMFVDSVKYLFTFMVNDIFKPAIEWIEGYIGPVWDTHVRPAWNSFIEFVREGWNRVLVGWRVMPLAIRGVAAAMVAAFETIRANIPVLIQNFTIMGSWIVENLPKFFEIALTATIDVFMSFADSVRNILSSLWSGGFDGARDALADAFEQGMRRARTRMREVTGPTLTSFIGVDRASPWLQQYREELQAEANRIRSEFENQMSSARNDNERRQAERARDLATRQLERRRREGQANAPGGIGGMGIRPPGKAEWGDILSVWKNMQQRAFGLTYEDMMLQQQQRQLDEQRRINENLVQQTNRITGAINNLARQAPAWTVGSGER